MKVHLTTSLAIAAVVLAGCGSGTQTGPRVATVAASEREVVSETEIVVRGDLGPDDHGPFALHGAYDVRFTQRGAGVDFTAEVPFTAYLEQPAADGPGRQIALFEEAAASGRTRITAEGRWHVVVDFGDSPYEIRLRRVGS